jgi:diadenosine tetraphosphate (Ap4A) HIT family hydrolase
MTMNQTILRFGYPDTLVAQYAHWVVLLRPEQPTLGALVLAAVGVARALGELPAEAFLELRDAVAVIETALAGAVRFEKINYLMLMMVDPHVHWHVLPRYDGVREAAGITVPDAGWPKAPALAETVKPDPAQTADLVAWLRSKWPGPR